jgi:hypothetical protein
MSQKGLQATNFLCTGKAASAEKDMIEKKFFMETRRAWRRDAIYRVFSEKKVSSKGAKTAKKRTEPQGSQ